VLEKLAARGEITRDQKVVVVSTANGLKFSDFKLRYHQAALDGMDTSLVNRPVELPNDYDSVRRAIDERT